MIGIIGNGVVGAALRDWFDLENATYDINPDRSPNTLEEVLACPWVFVAINVTDNAVGDGYVALHSYLAQMKPGTKVVIKTTVVPGTCDRLAADFPDLKVFYNPEFLTEAHAEEDFLQPFVQTVGAGDPNDPDVQELLDMLPPAPQAVVTRKQAEWFKHAIAGWLSTKVTWFNQLYDALGEDFDTVRGLMLTDPRTGATHTNVWQDGYRGWGGKCFTKDTPAFTEASGMPIMREVVEYNRKLRG